MKELTSSEIRDLLDLTFSTASMRDLDSKESRVMLVAIGYQESRFKHRRQQPLRAGGAFGPANGFWQFERGGGVKGVINHPASRDRAKTACRMLNIAVEPMAAWQALATSDVLACSFARLLLLTDPRPLPKVGDQTLSWDYYTRNWRPGKPHLSTWAECYGKALAVVK